MRWLFVLLLLTACENQVNLANHEIPSVKWEHHNQASGEEPICYDANVTKTDEKILCEWNCHMFWTHTHGVRQYYVSRAWILTGGQWVSGQYFPYPENQNEVSYPCS